MSTMQINFPEALRSLPPGTVYTIANTARPPADYLGATLLPERALPSYQVSTGSLTIRPTFAGLAAMDSPYPAGGAMSVTTFLETAAKIANEVSIGEQPMRTLQDMLLRMQGGMGGVSTTDAVANVALNFLNKVILQAHFDTMEWLRWQALTTGALAWDFNGIRLAVSYGLPAGTFLPQRTGNDAYGGSASKFWDDVRLIQRFLGYRLRSLFVSPNTFDVIISNAVNNIEITSGNPATGLYTLRRLVTRSNTPVLSSDARDTIQIVAYGRGGEVFDLANVGATKRKAFLPDGLMVAVGVPDTAPNFVVMTDATDEPQPDAIGYTHLAPTVEGGGTPGRWADLFTPQNEPYKLIGRGVTNGLPVIENNPGTPLLCVGSTEMPA